MLTGVSTGRDWHDWHRPYGDPGSELSQRLRLVQGHIRDWLDRRTDGSLTVVSVCAGQGFDLFGVLDGRTDARRIRATLVEMDARNVAAASRRAAVFGGQVALIRADAGDLATYRDLAPADLVLLVGVLGNITDVDVERTIRTLPQLCADAATVVWTRTRRPPDLTPAVRAWFADAGFVERAFDAPEGLRYAVGVHELSGRSVPLRPTGRMFRFVR